MKRRNFLKGILGLPAIVAGGTFIASAINIVGKENKISTYGLAVTKGEGESITFDGDLCSEKSSFKKAMWPGINKWYKNNYENYKL